MARPAKRPKPWDKGMMEKICERLISGESAVDIFNDPTMPNKNDFYNYKVNNESFGKAIARAYEAQQDAFVDEMRHLAATATPEDVNVKKLQIWTNQWIAARRAPKKYGEKVDVTSGGEKLPTPILGGVVVPHDNGDQ